MINPNRIGYRFFLLLASCVLFFTFYLNSAPAYAHKVQMFAHAEGDKVFVEGYFPDGKKTINSEVTVYDNKSGEELLKGKTDDKGKFSFKIPRKTDLRISLNASLGHKTEYILPGSDLPDAGKNKPAAAVAASGKTRGDNTGGEENSQPAKASQVDAGEIQAMVERGIEKGVSPLMREFSGCKEHVFFSEIIGGIGYIFGVLGIILYFKSRKSQK